MSRMLFVTSTLIWALLPAKAEVLTLSCDGTMKTEQERPHAITKMALIVNFDARIVTGFTEITARIDEVNANSPSFWGGMVSPWHHRPDHRLAWCGRDMVQSNN